MNGYKRTQFKFSLPPWQLAAQFLSLQVTTGSGWSLRCLPDTAKVRASKQHTLTHRPLSFQADKCKASYTLAVSPFYIKTFLRNLNKVFI